MDSEISPDDPTVAGEGRRSSVEPQPAERRLGSYALLDAIGRGGAGTVYRARHLTLGKTAAVKVLEGASEAEVARFVHEARAMAELVHPHVVPVHDVGCSGSTWYLVMDLAEGGTLAGLVRSGAPVGLDRGLATVEKVARAVAAAHERGILHRDLKPSNVLLRADGEPLVADFGLARRLDAPGDLTRTGEVVGTPIYMAPEQVAGRRDLDERVDVYALGAILFETLSGRPPYLPSGAPERDLLAVASTDPPALRQLVPSIPRPVETIVQVAMARESERRYPSALALAEDIRRHREGEPIRARPPSIALRLRRVLRRRRAVLVPLAALLVALWALALFLLERAEGLRSWQTVYETSFDRPNDLAAWRPVDGAWRVGEGALTVDGGTPARIAFGEPIAGDVRVSFSAALEDRPGGLASDLSVAFLPGGATSEAEGYFVGFGSDGNTISKILRRGARVAVAEDDRARIVPGRTHRVVVDRVEGVLRLAVDDRAVLEHRDLFPLGLGGRTTVVLYSWDAVVRVDELRIESRPAARKARRTEVADWIFERGEPRAAALLYADVLEDPGIEGAERDEIELKLGLAELAAAGEAGDAGRRLRAGEVLAGVRRRSRDPGLRARADLGLAEIDLVRGDLPAVLEAARAARGPAPDLARDFLSRAQRHLAASDRLEDRLTVLAATLDLFPGEPSLEVEVRTAEAATLLDLGRVADAIDVLGSAHRRFADHPFHGPALLFEISQSELRRLGFEAARRAVRRCRESAGGRLYWTLQALAGELEVEAVAGELATARSVLDRARSLVERAGGMGKSMDRTMTAILDLAEGDSSALERLDEIARAGAAAGTGEEERSWAANAALESACHRIAAGDEAGARSVLVPLAFDGRQAAAADGWGRLVAALLAYRAGDREAARRTFRRLARRPEGPRSLRRLALELGEGVPSTGSIEDLLSACGDATRDRAIAALALGVVAEDPAIARRLLEDAAGRGLPWTRAAAGGFATRPAPERGR